MTSLYKPVSGHPRLVDGAGTPKKMFLPSYQRRFAPGSFMWDNGAYGIEPATLSASNAGDPILAQQANATYHGNNTSLLLEQTAFAALFAGIAGEGRDPQQLYSSGLFSVPKGAVAIPDDASRNFITVYDEGIVVAPYNNYNGGTVLTAVATQLERGTLVAVAGFKSGLTVAGFYDPSGTEESVEDYFLYMNAVQEVGTGASYQQNPTSAIGILTERAQVGQTFLKFKIMSQAALLASIG